MSGIVAQSLSDFNRKLDNIIKIETFDLALDIEAAKSLLESLVQTH